MLRLAGRQLGWTPRAVDARRPLRSDQPEVLATLVLDVVVVADWLHVLAVLVLADVSHQQHSTVSYVARIVARVCTTATARLDMGPFLLTQSNPIHSCVVLNRTRKLLCATDYSYADF